MSATSESCETNKLQNELAPVDSYWRAANFLSAAQIYLKENSLLREPLAPHQLKPRLLGHWGTCPGLTFIYAHLNRVIRKTESRCLFLAGPGHGGAAVNACAFLDRAYEMTYPDFPYRAEGVEKLVTAFSWPGGSSSHVSPYTPGSIHEGGELGYALAHAFGAVLDKPDLVAVCVVGDGEAETGPTATSWHANKFLNPQCDGAVLPILHLNEYKIASPSLFSALSAEELEHLFRGYGYEPRFVEGDQPAAMHQTMAQTLDQCFQNIKAIREQAANRQPGQRPRWPLIILRTPKGWTGPQSLDGQPVEGSYRSHQVPLADVHSDRTQLEQLATWLQSYRPDELFDDHGVPSELVQANLPPEGLAMSLCPETNGGNALTDLILPDLGAHAKPLSEPGQASANPSQTVGIYLRDVVSNNPDNFRIFSPDEFESNRLDPVFENTDRVWMRKPEEGDTDLAPKGRVMEALSEHLCQGWLEGYLLTGRHGLFSSYEAFIHIVDSMVNQYAKWIKVSKETKWRTPLASLNYLLSSHVWQQDHNGFTHQAPGFLNHLLNQKAGLTHIYLPPDANTLLYTVAHCLGSRNSINAIVTGKKDAPLWFGPEEAQAHCQEGLGRIGWAGNLNEDETPEIVLACAGDVPTLETIACAALLKQQAPNIRFSVINIVDLLCIQHSDQYINGKSHAAFEALFPKDVPVVFAFHGYPSLVHQLLHERRNNRRFDVHGYLEEGGTTTPFDMLVSNKLDRYSLMNAVAHALPDHSDANRLADFAALHLDRHANYIRLHGADMPEVSDFRAKNPA
ncbi:phosphoketolase family protein [Pelagicoccus sp. SDUM812005]|uniref:phosphoketolase family protein n=1 Tax=Pelagicoccus sp. SDUM812005 TaxID=3041257 RepID=UPI00280EB7EF|nr:phosphoketolase family protein [Pelagicoccus sp. SDUM812005]MDQ8181092.1 phosphoketolase family protein [Pelagicoccus sp. SDUM812005]